MEYQLTTLADVFNQVPSDKIELCLAEVGKAMAMSKELCNELDVKPNWPNVIGWTDDGKGNVGFELEAPDGVLSAKFRKEK